MTLTEPQRKIMMAVMRQDYPSIMRLRLGFVVASRLLHAGMVEWSKDTMTGRKLTPAGWTALMDVTRRRWAKSGCKAYQDDLNEVEAAYNLQLGTT